MKSQRRTLSLVLLALSGLILLPGFASSQQREHEIDHGHVLCGSFPPGPGLPPGAVGFVDRFNHPWVPSKQLVEAQLHRKELLASNCGGVFRIDFEDAIRHTGVGFDDPTPVSHPILGATTLGTVRQRTICEMFGYLAATLEVQGSPDILVRASQTDGSGFLAAATPLFTTAPSAGFTGGTLFDHITTGVDPTPAPGVYDAWIIFDFGPWTISGQPYPINSDWNEAPGSRIDLYSVALHEATHALGFLSLIGPNGSSGIGGAYSLYDSQLRTASGTTLIDPVTRTFRATPADLLSDGIVFDSERCSLISPVYSPARFAPGSSLSHFDSYRSAIRYVMRWATSGGEDRKLTEPELQALCTIGHRLQGNLCSGCAPVSRNDTASTFSGVEVCVDVLANDYDPDGATLTIHQGLATLVAGRGTVEVRNDRICFTPPADFTGPAYITYAPFNGSRAGRPATLIVWVVKNRGGVSGLDSGLIAYWSFDDSTATDNSGNGNHGTYNDRPQPAPGVCGAGIYFDGVNDYIRIPTSPSLESLKQMTVSYWIKFYSVGDGPGQVANTIGNGSDDMPWGRPGFFTYSARNTIRHALGSTTVGTAVDITVDATVPLDEQEYYFVTFTASEDTMKVYRNGCLIAQTPRKGAPIARQNDWTIAWSGDYSGDGAFMNGYMDEIRIHDRPLSHEEILEYYEMCGGRRGLDVGAHLSFGVLECPRTDSSASISVRNETADPVAMSARLANGRAFSITDGAPTTMPPKTGGEITVRFAPPRPGYYVDTLIVEGDCTGPHYVVVSGAREACGTDEGSVDLALAKIVSDSLISTGDRVIYTITVGNNGPSEARSVIARDLVPSGVNVISHGITGPPASFNPVTGILSVPLIAVGDAVHLTIVGTVDDKAPDTIVNCVELVGVEGGDRDFTNDIACASFLVVRCPMQAPARIGRNYLVRPGNTVHTPIELLADVSMARVRRVRISLSFDSTFIVISNPHQISDLLDGTLVKDWLVESITSRKGHYEITLQAPGADTWLRGTGRLLNPEFKLYLGSRLASDLDFQVDLLDQDCATIDPSPGQAGLDSICGLNYRLIEFIPDGLKVALEQNRPNPFGGVTNIYFHTGLDGHVRLEVLDAGGYVVATLIDGDLPAGAHQVQWNAGGHPTGLYFCRLDLGYATFMKQMLLMK